VPVNTTLAGATRAVITGLHSAFLRAFQEDTAVVVDVILSSRHDDVNYVSLLLLSNGWKGSMIDNTSNKSHIINNQAEIEIDGCERTQKSSYQPGSVSSAIILDELHAGRA
jgi:hypothetical protein